MPVLMFINIKGGVAKTTNAVAVSEFLAEARYRVLVIDADHQCAAGELLLGEPRLEQSDFRRSTLHDLLGEMLKEEFHADAFADYIVPVASKEGAPHAANLSVIPCSLRIDDFQRNYNKARQDFHSNEEFHAVLARRFRDFRNWLQANFDFTIIDCPPSLPVQVQMLVKVADAYVIPSVPDKLSVRGSHYLVERLRRKHFKIPGLGTIWSLYREQNSIHRDMISLASRRKDLFAGIPDAFDTIIPNATAIARAMECSGRLPLNEKYSPPFANKYRNLVGEIVERCHAAVSNQ